jgi:endonuclease/exonuclease/phosphatase family metal-dependent hydrolase
VAGVLRPGAPDIALLQECGGPLALRRFASRLEMEVVSSHGPFSRVRNAVLYRPPWRLSGVDIRTLTREGRTLRRGFIAAHLRQEWIRLTAASVHLGLAPGERERHSRELMDFLGTTDGHLILGGDLNEGPEGAAARWVADRLFDLFAEVGDGSGETFPALGPTARIDYLFASDGIRGTAAWVPAGSAVSGFSDHLPVMAEVDIEEP